MLISNPSNILLVPAILAMVIVPSLLPPQNFGTVCQLVSVMPLQLNVSNPISSVSCLILLIDYFGLSFSFDEIRLC